MRKLCGFCLALAFAIGCGKDDGAKGKETAKETTKPKSSDDEEGAADLAALKKMKEELCACKDRACADPIRDKVDNKVKAMMKEYEGSLNKNILHYAMESQMAAIDCMMKLK
jgi:hypothetical protein